MKHLVKKAVHTKKRRAGPSALSRLRKTPGLRGEMIGEAQKDQNPDIPLSKMGIVDSVLKKIKSEKPKPANKMKRA
ncbi:MAG: hypothetical protein WAL75_07780 [Terracidiphilus sp.]